MKIYRYVKYCLAKVQKIHSVGTEIFCVLKEQYMLYIYLIISDKHVEAISLSVAGEIFCYAVSKV